MIEKEIYDTKTRFEWIFEIWEILKSRQRQTIICFCYSEKTLTCLFCKFFLALCLILRVNESSGTDSTPILKSLMDLKKKKKMSSVFNKMMNTNLQQIEANTVF